MNDVVIRAEHLGKRYQIGHRETIGSLRDTLIDIAALPFRAIGSTRGNHNTTNSGSSSDHTIWALRDVSFEIRHGDTVGIIGKNGAGKSTLLKILSRITEPSEGLVQIRGQVSSLLEVGTGFHPELTGRENIYLNGAILGMRKAEIDRKFDEIVAFAEIEKFIDTPVKHYSSGMYVRLAFAVAAHLEPDILLVDEVLAVGDAAFQRKCLGKMGDVAKQGQTVLFVSHNMGAIIQLCPVSILLQAGKITALDKSDSIVGQYLAEGQSKTPDVHIDSRLNPNSPIVLTRCWIADRVGDPISTVDVTKEFSIGLEILVRRAALEADISVRVHNALGQPLFTTSFSQSEIIQEFSTPGKFAFLIQVPSHFLAPDTYFLHVGIHRPNIVLFDVHDQALTFRVEESGSSMWQYRGKAYGNILVRFPWQNLVT